MAKKTKTTRKTRKKTPPSKLKILAKRAAALKKRAKKKTHPARRKRLPKQLEKIITTSAFGTPDNEPPKEEIRIEESKFDIGIPYNAHAQPSYDIPLEYHVDRAVILTVDPRFVFAYWEVKNESMHEALKQGGPNAKLTLRFYDISASGNPETSPSWDIEVFDRLGNWYLRLDYPEQRLCLDVGIKNEYGAFYRLARSNVIKLPRAGLAAPGPIKWMVVSPDGEKIITDVEEYTDADLKLLRKILGPYFFDLLIKGQFASITGSSMEAIFQEVAAFRIPMEISSSPTTWSGKP